MNWEVTEEALLDQRMSASGRRTHGAEMDRLQRSPSGRGGTDDTVVDRQRSLSGKDMGEVDELGSMSGCTDKAICLLEKLESPSREGAEEALMQKHVLDQEKRSRIQPLPKHDLYRKTLILYFSFVCLGLSSAVIGPTLVDVEAVLQVDTKTISMLFIPNNIGFLVGGYVGGQLYDRRYVPPEFQFGLVFMLMGVTTAMAVWPAMFGIFMACVGMQGFSMGYAEAAGTAYGIHLWIGKKYADAGLQSLHSMWSIGTTISPLLVQFFLVSDVSYLGSSFSVMNNSSEFFNYDNASMLAKSNVTDLPLMYNTTTLSEPRSKSMIKYGYVMIGGFITVGGILFLFESFFFKSACSKESTELVVVARKINPNPTGGWCIDTTFIALVFAWNMFYVGYGTAYVALIALFSVKGLHMSTRQGALITALHVAMMGVGRILAIPLSICLFPAAIMGICMILVMAGMVLFTFCVHMHVSIVWVSALLTGLGKSAQTATLETWISRHRHVTGSVASAITAGSASGAMSIIPLSGYLFQTYGHMTLPYVCIAVCIVTNTVFGSMYCFRKCHRETQKAKMDTDDSHFVPLKQATKETPHISERCG